MLELYCPHCGQVLRIPIEYVGRQGGCAYCKGTFIVPPARGPYRPVTPSAVSVKPIAAVEVSRVITVLGVGDPYRQIVKDLCSQNNMTYSEHVCAETTHLLINPNYEHKAAYKSKGIPILSLVDFCYLVPTAINLNFGDSWTSPASSKQLFFLESLGLPPYAIAGISKREASAYIDCLLNTRLERLPPTEKQVNFLLEQGVSLQKTIALKNRLEASELVGSFIDANAELIEHCWKCGANAKDIFEATTDSEIKYLLKTTMGTASVRIPEVVHQVAALLT